VLRSDLKWIGPRVVRVVSLNAARCLTQCRFDLNTLKPLVGCLVESGVFLDAEIAATSSTAQPAFGEARDRRPDGPRGPDDCLQKRHNPQVSRLA
jgi:hypothetical protein